MKKLIVILICCLFIAPNVIADCAKPDGITLGAKRDIVEREFNKNFGEYFKKDAHVTRWNLTKENYIACIFYNNIFYGFMNILLQPASEENGLKLVKVFNGFEEVIKEDGFVFEKEYKKESGALQTVTKEFFCPGNPRIKVTISLSRDLNKKIYSVDLLHFISNEVE